MPLSSLKAIEVKIPKIVVVPYCMSVDYTCVVDADR